MILFDYREYSLKLTILDLPVGSVHWVKKVTLTTLQSFFCSRSNCPNRPKKQKERNKEPAHDATHDTERAFSNTVATVFITQAYH